MWELVTAGNVSCLLCWCRGAQGTGNPPFSIFVGNDDVTTPNSYTVLDNTNCTATAVAFTQNSQTLAVPCPRQGRYVVIKSTGGPLVLCEVSVYGKLQFLNFEHACVTSFMSLVPVIAMHALMTCLIFELHLIVLYILPFSCFMPAVNMQCAGYTPDSSGAATESAGNDVSDLILTNNCGNQFKNTGASESSLTHA